MNENSHMGYERGSGVVALSFLVGVGSKIVHTSMAGESLDSGGCCPSSASSCLDHSGDQGAAEGQQWLRAVRVDPCL